MKGWTALSEAIAGWVMLLRGDEDWRTRFSLTLPGLATALVIFAMLAFLAVAFASASVGMPSPAGVVAAMFVLALPVTALAMSLAGTRMLLKGRAPGLEVMVPGIYAATGFLVAEGLLAVIGGPLVLLSWLALAFLFYRLARAATDWNAAIAAAFAVLSVVLLVAMRVALYMLSSVAPSPI